MAYSMHLELTLSNNFFFSNIGVLGTIFDYEVLSGLLTIDNNYFLNNTQISNNFLGFGSGSIGVIVTSNNHITIAQNNIYSGNIASCYGFIEFLDYFNYI